MLGHAMEAEIRQQPALFSAHSASFFEQFSAALGGKRFDMVLLAARGSSDNAALYARYLIEIHLGIPVSLAAPSVLTRYGVHVKYPNCLAVGISQSGAAPDVAEVLTSLREAGHTTVAITNTADSRLTHAAEHSVLLEAGKENAVAATKTYSTSLLALHEMVRALGGSLPDPAASLPDDAWVQSTHDAALAGLGPILRSHTLFALARGYDYATALESALKLMECALLSCKSYSSADFAHGPKALAGHGAAAIVYGEPIPYLAEQGCVPVVAPAVPGHVPASLRPVWDAFFAQWVALLAARARGLNPDAPAHLSKVTETL